VESWVAEFLSFLFGFIFITRILIISFDYFKIRMAIMASKKSQQPGIIDDLGQEINNEIDNESFLNEAHLGFADPIEGENSAVEASSEFSDQFDQPNIKTPEEKLAPNAVEASSEFSDQFDQPNIKTPEEKLAPNRVKAALVFTALMITLFGISLIEFDLKVKTIDAQLGPGQWAHIESFTDGALNDRFVNEGDRVTLGSPVAYLSDSHAQVKVDKAHLKLEREKLKLENLRYSQAKYTSEVNMAEMNLQNAYLIFTKMKMFGGTLPPPEMVDLYKVITLPNRPSIRNQFNNKRVQEELKTIRISLEERFGGFAPEKGMPITISNHNEFHHPFWQMMDAASEELLETLKGKKGKKRNIEKLLERFIEFEDGVFGALSIMSLSTEPALESGVWMQDIVEQYISLRDQHRNEIYDLVTLDEKTRRLEKVVKKYPLLKRQLNILRKEFENFFAQAAIPVEKARQKNWNGRVAAKQVQKKANEFIDIALPLLDAFSKFIGAEMVAPRQEIENLRSTMRKFQQRVDHLLHLRSYAMRSVVMHDEFRSYLTETQQNLEAKLLGTINMFLKTEENLRRVLQKQQDDDRQLRQQLAGTQKKLRDFLRNQPIAQMTEIQALIREKQSALELVKKEARDSMIEKETLENLEKEAQLALKSAERNMQNCTVRAPLTGIVTKLNMDVGGRIERHSPLGLVEDFKEYLLRAQVSQEQVELVSPGQVVDVILESNEDRIIHGKVKWVAEKNSFVNDEYRNIHWNVLISVNDSVAQGSIGSTDGYAEVTVGSKPLFQLVLKKVERFAKSMWKSSTKEDSQKIIVDDPTQIRAQEFVGTEL
jgi:multidrug resistance efflux pump